MLRGILLGSAWGLVLGGSFLAVMSLTYPVTYPDPPEAGSDAPNEAASAEVDSRPSGLPATLTPPERHDAAQITRPEPAGSGVPAADLDPGAAPELSAPEIKLAEGPYAAPSAGMAQPDPESQVLPSPQSMPPAEPAPDAEPEIATTPAQPPRAEPGEEVTGFPMGDLSETTVAPDAVVNDPAATAEPDATATNAAPEAVAGTNETSSDPTTAATGEDTDASSEISGSPALDAPETGAAEQTTSAADGLDAPEAAEAAEQENADRVIAALPQLLPEPEPEAEAPGAQAEGDTAARPENTPQDPRTVTMPGAPGIRLTEEVAPETPPTPEPAPADSTPAPEDLSPIDRYAQPFENPEGKPVVSIVLLDSVQDGATEDIPDRFPYPISIAVPVDAEDAAARSKRYHDAGYDVLALASVPEGTSADKLETLAPTWFEAVPEAVALMERPPRQLQAGRETGERLAGILADSGHGLLLYPEGLDTTRKLASRRGVPAASVFRDLDGEGQAGAVVRRFLDNSAFRAGAEGQVILVARPRADTLEALLVWGLADRAGRVALAPVSYTLKRAAP